jgi:hypothetical protein
VLKNLLFIEILVLIGSVIFHLASTKETRREIGALPGILFGSMAAIAFLSPLLIITHIALGLLPLMLGRTKLKIGMIVAIGMFTLPALSSDIYIGSLWLVQWSIQGSLALGALIAFMIAPGRAASGPPWRDAVMIIIVMLLVVIGARGGSFVGWLRTLVLYLSIYALPVYVVTRSFRNAVERRTLLTAMAGAGIILAVIVIYEARGGWPLYSPLAQHYGFELSGLVVKWRGNLMRAYGPLSEATNMACVLVICFAAALASRRAFVSNTAYITVVSIIAVGTFVPQSRGGMIGLAIAFIVSSFYRRGIASAMQIMAAGLLLTGTYLVASRIGSASTQIGINLTEGTETGNYRSELLRRGTEEFWKNPILGDTYPNVVARMQDMVQGEGIVDFVNSYLYFALFTGGIGLVLFCLSFIAPITRLLSIRRRLPPGSAERDVAGFCLSFLTSAAVMLVFTSYLQRPSIFLLIASAFALMTQVPRRIASPQSKEVAPVTSNRVSQVA